MTDEELETITELQQDILEAKRDDPEKTPAEIADELDCSDSHAYRTLDQYDTADLERVDVVEGPDQSSDEGGSGIGQALALLIVGPIKLTVWIIVAGVYATLWIILLPFRILKAIFG